MSKLFEENDSESDLEIKTNTEFAKNYNIWRQKEELHKLQTKYKDDEDSDTSSSSDDNEGDKVEEKFDKDFLKTLSLLKNKDPRIYDKDFQLFEKHNELKETKSTTRKKKEQPMYIKDYERNLILEKGGLLSDDEEGTSLEKSKTYIEEQKELKEDLKNILKNIDEDENEDDNWGGMFKTREKTVEEKVKEEEDYLEWIAGQKEHLIDQDTENELKPLKDFWADPKLDEGEKFLRDYVLKKKFLDTDDDDYIPTYEEIVHDSDKDLSEDEKVISVQEEFEHKYNFRFEEPDKEFIKRFPRTMENSLRQKDDKRKIKRLERKERKIVEKQQKIEEIERLKSLKKAEIEEKIKKLQEVTGNSDVNFKLNDLEDDFDPDEHDKRMQSLFNDEFYKEPEGEQKPEFPELDEELQLENWDRWHGTEDHVNPENSENEEHEPHCEDETFNMDCDYDSATIQKELIDNTRRKKKRKRKSKFARVLSQPKPVFDPNNKTYEEYLNEYYSLDCEDIIGDTLCRFKYREVVPNSFGLSIEEILSAKDKELNRWCSLKKAIQHRPEHVEKYDLIAFEKKGKNLNLKKKYLPSLFTEESTDNDTIFPSTSMDSTSLTNATSNSIMNHTTDHNIVAPKRKNRKNENVDRNRSLLNNDIGDENEVQEKNDKAIESKEEGVSNNMRNKKNPKTIENLFSSNNYSEKQKQNIGEIVKNEESPDNKNNKNTQKNKNHKTIDLKEKALNSSTDIDNKPVKKQKQHRAVENVKNCINNDLTIPGKKKRPIEKLNDDNKHNVTMKKRKKDLQNIGKRQFDQPTIAISDARLSAYGINPKRFKNKLKYGNTK